MQVRSRREERRASGTCTRCGKPAAPGRTQCGDCLKREREYARRYYHAGAACDEDCENCLLPECVLEASPQEKALCRSMGLSDERKAAGLCTRCGKPSEGGHRYCAECRTAQREAYAEKARARREAGLCYLCGKRPPAPGSTKCEECASERQRMARKRYEKCVQNGVCANCRNAPMEGGRTLCAECHRKKLEYDRARRAGKEAKTKRKPAAGHPWIQYGKTPPGKKEEDK